MEDRSLEEIDQMVQFAKLDKSDLHSAVQCIYFSPLLGSDDIKLLEVDKNVLEDLLSGESLTIRGLKTDGAVLCTKKTTYEMKEAETSNTLLLLPQCATPDQLPAESEYPIYRKQQVKQIRFKQENGPIRKKNPERTLVPGHRVEAVKQSYFELKPVKPRLKRLRERLEENVYDGSTVDEETNQKKRKYTFDELLEEVQSSEDELRRGLEEIKACLIDGYWRLLDFDYQTQLLTSIIAAIDEHSWSIDRIPFTEVCQQLQDVYPLDVIHHILECFAAPDTSTNALVYYKLKDDAVSRFYAELILSATPEFNLHDFIETWQMSVPDGMQTDLSQLEGMVLVDRESRPEVIRHFPVSELPEDVEERFQELFRAKARWTLEEITPYVEGLCLDKQGTGVLLTKHTRVSSQNGVKLYSSKKL